MLGFRLLNLIIPGEHESIDIQCHVDKWTISKSANYNRSLKELDEKPTCVVETYDAFTEADYHEHLPPDLSLNEFQHLCLTLSYLTGTAITSSRSLPSSICMLIQFGDGFPRMRHLLPDNCICVSQSDFVAKTSAMMSTYAAIEQTHNITVLLHHWLDSSYCWSLEDLFLGMCTVLEIIKQNEIRRTCDKTFFRAISDTCSHYNLTRLSRDFVDMRNDIIHEGHLSKIKFPNKSRSECAKVVYDVRCWIDEYVHAIFNMGSTSKKRQDLHSITSLNSYTTW